MPLAPGTIIGPYRITALVGAGGMGEVYSATDANLGRNVAVKVLPEDMTADGERLARFEREARTLAALNHPNIAGIYGLEKAGTNPALIMEFVDGPTLADRIAAGPIAMSDALPIARQIADALEAAHSAGIVHRDLKPANIKVRDDGAVKVLDFGLAKSLDGGAAPGQSISPTISSPAMLTRAGVVLGTAAYMSPEQARGHAADKRSDIWAFGCVLFEMLTGRRAFGSQDETISDAIAAVLKTEPEWPALPADTPSAVTRLLRRCLAKERRERLHDIADARLELRDANLAEAPALARRGGSSRFPWVVAAAFALLFVVALVLLLRPRASPDTRTGAVRSVVVPPALDNTGPGGRSVTPRFARGVALSQDGRRLAFIAPGRDGRMLIWTRPLDGLSAQPLAGTEGASSPFWSPDGRHLAFVADRTLKRVDADGGAVLTIAEAANPFSTGTWNADDVILYATDHEIRRVRAVGGAATPATAPDAAMAHLTPFFLPDGQHFVFSLTPGGGTLGRGIAVGTLGVTDVKMLREGGSLPAFANGHLLFVLDDVVMAQRFDERRLELAGEATPLPDRVQIGGGPGTSGAFAVSQTGVLVYQAGFNEKSELAWLDRSGVVHGTLGSPMGFSYPQIAPDGRSVAVSVREDTQRYRDVWIYDVARGGRTRFTSEPSDDFSPVWSPDGLRIVYSAARSGGFNLYVRSLAGGEDRRLLDRDGIEIPSDWSPDGKFLLFQTQSPGADIFILSLEDSSVTPFATSRFGETGGQFSPDGRWIAYASDETGRSEVYIAPFRRPGARIAVSTAGGTSPRWSRDGRELFYVQGGSALQAVDIRASADRVDAGVARTLFRCQFRASPVLFAVSADGRFLVNRASEETANPPLTLVINWPASVAK